MTNIAIIGAGLMGDTHAHACQQLPDMRVTWVADQDRARATALADRIGARATTDNEEALSDQAVDAVIITVPTPFHRPVTERAAAHGKHVFCEKPIARTVADGEAMIHACRRAGARLMIGHVVRFFPEYVQIRELLQAGTLGQIGVARTSRLNVAPSAQRSWYADLERSGGLVIDMLIHDFDTLRWYFGEVERVFAQGLSYTRHQPTNDHAVALLRFESGVIAHAEASWAHSSFRTAIEIAGEHGIVRHASDEGAPIRIEHTASGGPGAGVVKRLSPQTEGPHQAELRHFVTHLRDGTPFLTEGDEAIRSLKVAIATLESIRTGRPIFFIDGHPQLEEIA